MKILYIGDFVKGNGPSSVDMSLKNEFNHSDINAMYIQANDHFSFSLIKHVFNADIIHISGVSFLGLILIFIAKILFKKTTMTMHGYLKVESKYRMVKNHRKIIELLQIYLVDRIFPVSKMLSHTVNNNKCIPIPNGTPTLKNNEFLKKDDNLITLIGGGRREKRNLLVCNIIKKINEKYGKNLKVNIYGEEGPDSDCINKFSFVRNFGFVDKNQVLKSLSQTNIFIQYSAYEPFSLSVADALNYQCFVITSEKVGIIDYIPESKYIDIVRDEISLEKSILKYQSYERKNIFKVDLPSWFTVSKMYIKEWGSLIE